MSDDYGSRYTSAYPFPLSASSNRLYSGSLSGSIGPDDTSDEDWFKIPMLKGATYQLQVIGGPEVYDLNDAKVTLYKPNGISTLKSWSYDQSRRNGYVYNDGILVTAPIEESNDYYLKVDLDSFADDLDVGNYIVSVNQLTEGFTTYLTQSLATTMTDDFGNRYTNAHTFPLTVDGSGLASGSLQGILGPEDTSDEDWFKVRLLKGATYQFQLSGGSEVYDLNDSRITWYKPNGISTINYWSFDQNRRNGYVYNDGIYTTSPIESSDDYYLRVDLDTYADDLDVGQYTISVEQLTPGFAAPTPTPAPRPVPLPTAAPLPTTAPLPTAQTPTPGAQKPTKPGAAAGPTVINNYYTTNNTNTTNTSTNTSNNTNNNTNTTINNTGNGTVQTGNIGTVENTNDIDTNITIETSFELKSVNVNLSLAITGESKKSEKVEGTTGDDLIADGAGKDKLIGNEGADQFYFSGNEPYKKNKADQVVDFNTAQGDQIIVADQIFFNPIITNSVLEKLGSNPAIPVANNKRDLRKISQEDHDFVYYKPKGELYMDTNDAGGGFAEKKSDADPLIGNLGRKQDLTNQSLGSLVEDLKEEKASEPEITVATNKKEFKEAKKEGVDLVYYEPKGDLYVDGNGEKGGFGNRNQGGIIADLPKNTPLTEADILVGE